MTAVAFESIASRLRTVVIHQRGRAQMAPDASSVRKPQSTSRRSVIHQTASTRSGWSDHASATTAPNQAGPRPNLRSAHVGDPGRL